MFFLYLGGLELNLLNNINNNNKKSIINMLQLSSNPPVSPLRLLFLRKLSTCKTPLLFFFWRVVLSLHFFTYKTVKISPLLLHSHHRQMSLNPPRDTI